MSNYNFISTAVNSDRPDLVSRIYSALQRLRFKNAPHLKPTISNLLKPLLRDKPEHIQNALRAHSLALFPGLLKPYTDRSDIYKQRKYIIKDLEKHANSDIDISLIWTSFCEHWNLPIGMKQPSKSNLLSYRYWFITLRRLIKKATFVYDTVTSPTDQYVSNKYLQYSLSLRHRYNTYLELDGRRLKHSEAQMYSQYCRCSAYKVRAEGIAKLAINRGLSPYAFTITPVSRYNMHSTTWRGESPDQISKRLTDDFRKATDALRHAGYDVEIIRVIEFMLSGTPHIHLLLFASADIIAKIENIFRKVFINSGNCGSAGVHVKNVYDVSGQINYMLKTLWGALKYHNDYENEIMAISEVGAFRRFGHTSIKYKYPSMKIFQEARMGRASLLKHYENRLRGDIKNTPGAITDIEAVMNNAAKNRDYAGFARAFWNATGSDEEIAVNKEKPIDIYDLMSCSQLRLYNPDNYTSTPAAKQNKAKKSSTEHSSVNYAECSSLSDTS